MQKKINEFLAPCTYNCHRVLLLNLEGQGYKFPFKSRIRLGLYFRTSHHARTSLRPLCPMLIDSANLVLKFHHPFLGKKSSLKSNFRSVTPLNFQDSSVRTLDVLAGPPQLPGLPHLIITYLSYFLTAGAQYITFLTP